MEMNVNNTEETDLEVGEERTVLFVKGAHFKEDKSCKFAADIFSHRFMFIMHEKEIKNRSIRSLDSVFKKDILQAYGINSTANLPYFIHDVFRGHQEEDDPNGGRRIIAQFEKIWEGEDPGVIESYLEDKFQPKLVTNNPEAYKVQLDVFHKFILYLKTKNGDVNEANRLKGLINELRKINTFLTKQGTKYLSGDTIKLPDCQLLPKLYQIRIGGKYYKQFVIPDDFSALERYVENGDEEEGFRESMPSEREIIKALEKHLPPRY